MFGESDSESPRVGSPWDSLLSSGASTPSSVSGLSDPDPPKIYKLSLPKLVPEAEEGNVEYKLQLIEPSPERFLRLVTQLKWRLLEGGGQAYYELGVADSGQLVGLTRQNLDRSLETLEAMAGEIGASVVVVKEIEVPPSMFEPANSNVMLPKGKTMGNGKPKGAERPGKAFRSRPSDWGAVEIVRGNSAPTLATDKDALANGVSTKEHLGSQEEVCLTVRISPHPVIPELPPSDDGSPSPISPTSDDGMFPLDPVAELQLFSTTLSLAERPSPNSRSSSSRGSQRGISNPAFRAPDQIYTFSPSPHLGSSSNSEQVKKDLDTLHVPLATSSNGSINANANGNGDENGAKLGSPIHPIQIPKKSKDAKKLAPQIATTAYTGPISEPRLIVEALVVRKLSADEAFLDFGGFTLAD